ncbi:tryptophan-rich sensory protein [Streptomyces sp. NPDC058695]|uniref:tryptophan-rich sensory protein n=1 Tax=Streptomyces sp. NPDC058695 TaxID=3346604 RepID=UPI003650E24C
MPWHVPKESVAARWPRLLAWTWLFFGHRSPRAGLVGTLMLDLSNIELIHRTARVDTDGARALLPDAGWCAFARGAQYGDR